MRAREFLPECLKNYFRLTARKLRYRDSFVDSPLIARGVELAAGCSVSRGAELGPGVRLGAHSYVNCGAIVASGEIGRFCSIGPYALIGMPEHPLGYPSTSPRLYSPNNIFSMPSEWNDYPNPPIIGCDVWIGAHAFVRQGVKIGHGAVIAAGAVVVRDVAPYEIAGGVPARRIRYRFAPDIIATLLEERWWEKDLSEMAQYADRFQRDYVSGITETNPTHHRAHGPRRRGDLADERPALCGPGASQDGLSGPYR
jgi:acetyltransferase-like isoleucine patch superfamily enzyme